MPIDGNIAVQPDSTGKKVDTSELTRADGVTVVERQRMVNADDTNALAVVKDSPARGQGQKGPSRFVGTATTAQY